MKKRIIYSYIIIETLMYLTFMTLDVLDLASLVSSILKFIGIFLCLVMSLILILLYGYSKNRIIICCAMLFTVISDVFLLFTDMFIIGVSTFCIVQTVYLMWLCRLDNRMAKVGELEDRSRRNKLVVGRVISASVLRLALAAAITLLIFIFGKEFELLYCVAIFYAVSFIDNIRRAVVMLVTKRNQSGEVRFKLIVFGLILFFMCDVNVLLYNIQSIFPGFLKFSDLAGKLSFLGMWFFYLPAQVMLTLSNATKKRLI